MGMLAHWCDEVIAYDGSQLRAHWLLQRFDMAGDAIVGFRGPCSVRRDEIADLGHTYPREENARILEWFLAR